MEREARQGLSGHLKNQVVDKLLEVNEIDVPKALIDEEIGRLQQQAVQQALCLRVCLRKQVSSFYLPLLSEA